MNTELILIETDLMCAEHTDVNLRYIKEKCTQLGMPVACQMNITWDNEQASEMFQFVLGQSDVTMIVCGAGIRVSEVKQYLLEKRPEKEKDLEEIQLGGKDQPGWILRCGKKMAAVCSKEDIQTVFEKELYPLLQKEQKEVPYFTTLKLCGISDLKVKEAIKSIQEKSPAAQIMVQVEEGDVCIRISAAAEEEHLSKKTVKAVVKSCMEKFKDAIYATDEATSLEAAVLSLLKEKDLTLTTAESLTGGLLASKFTAVPGASEVFKQGFVTYCNRAKKKLLDVKKTTLKEYGAVSDRTAKEMAKNGAFATGADVCVSLTGLAGPAAEEGKPVGLVYIACCYKNRTVVREHHFKGDRNQIREQSARQALILLRECILADQ